MNANGRPTIHHIPICPFSQRVEILLALKGLADAFAFEVVDVTKPRSPALLAKTRGVTAMPALVLEDGHVILESLVIMRYVEDRFPTRPTLQREPWPRALENMLVAKEGGFVTAGYALVLNQDPGERERLTNRLLGVYADLDAFLLAHAPDREFLFDEFGWAEAVYTPMFVRFEFLAYYEGFELPDEPRFARVRRWRAACMAHRAAQQVSREAVIKLYYDYAQGVGNGGLLPGRTRSSFAFEPHWSTRPWPPSGKYGAKASDAELGLGVG